MTCGRELKFTIQWDRVLNFYNEISDNFGKSLNPSVIIRLLGKYLTLSFLLLILRFV